jgi:ketosteroid isomerase-like protein
MNKLARAAVTAVFLTFALPAAAQSDDPAINAVYDGIAAAKARNDAPGIAAAFVPEALLIDARPGPATAGSELAGRLGPMAQSMARDQARVTTQYRIERRSRAGDVTVDAGYMRQAITGPGMSMPPMVTRFLVTLRRQPDGSWRILSDASMPATEAAWAAAARQPGLKFDD